MIPALEGCELLRCPSSLLPGVSVSQFVADIVDSSHVFYKIPSHVLLSALHLDFITDVENGRRSRGLVVHPGLWEPCRQCQASAQIWLPSFSATSQTLPSADVCSLSDPTELKAAQLAAGGFDVFSAYRCWPRRCSASRRQDGSRGRASRQANSAELSQGTTAAGERLVHQLRRRVRLANTGQFDAIVFAPLNKSSLKLAGVYEEDELRCVTSAGRFFPISSS